MQQPSCRPRGRWLDDDDMRLQCGVPRRGVKSIRLRRGMSVALSRSCVLAMRLAAALLAAVSLYAEQERLPHDTDQSVTPASEGWYRNPDGTFSLSFGYLNRNLKEDLDIPVGPHNSFSPGPMDRGQPTHFVSRTRGDLRRQFGSRAVGVFSVVVPKDFGPAKLTWTL